MVRRLGSELGGVTMVGPYIRAERLSLKVSTQFNEKWVQKLIADDPAILGLGDLVLRDQERMQPRAGRLDLLLQDPETTRRYRYTIREDDVSDVRSVCRV